MTNEIINMASRSGSVGFNEIVPLLLQQELLYNYLTSTLNIVEAGSATRLGNHWQHLGGSRVAPYEFAASPHNTVGSFVIVIDASTVFYDDEGNTYELGDPEAFDNAVRFTETLLSVSIRESQQP